MKTLEIKKMPIEMKLLKKRTAFEDDCKTLIDHDCLVTENGKPIILYKKINELDTSAVRWAVKNLTYRTETRTAGLKSNSSIFGYSPRIVLRKDYCTATLMARNEPKQHSIITKFASEISKIYAVYFPDVYSYHQKIVLEKVKTDWVIQDSPFTSGIVNKNNPLKYHHDAGNFPNVLSNMIVFKQYTEGGRLACPEYDIKFEVADNTVIIFDGQKILHGVTPIKNINKASYRYSIVYYSLSQMWNCGSINEELVRIRKVKREREVKRISHEPNLPGVEPDTV